MVLLQEGQTDIYTPRALNRNREMELQAKVYTLK